MATATDTRPGARAQIRYARMSAFKARAVLDQIRGQAVGRAEDVLTLSERGPSQVIAQCLASAVSNAAHNEELDPEELYVSACFADEGPTLRRWRPRARGRATRIRKRTCHITVVVSRWSEEELARERERQESTGRRARSATEARRRRVARSRGEEPGPSGPVAEGDESEETAEELPEEEVAEEEEEVTDETAAEPDAESDEGDDDAAPAKKKAPAKKTTATKRTQAKKAPKKVAKKSTAKKKKTKKSTKKKSTGDS